MPASNCKVSNHSHSIPCNLKHPIPTSQACIRYSSHVFRNDYFVLGEQDRTVLPETMAGLKELALLLPDGSVHRNGVELLIDELEKKVQPSSQISRPGGVPD